MMTDRAPGAAGGRWRVEASADESLRKNKSDAVLVLQLGLATTALRAAQRLTICVEQSSENTPAEMRDRLWAFVLAVAYLHEIRVTVQPRFPRVRDLAVAAGAPSDLVQDVGELLSGKTALSKVIARVRNKLVFHFDKKLVAAWVEKYEKDVVVWQQAIGTTVGGTLHQASTDVVAANLLPGVDAETPEGRAEFEQLMNDVLGAQDKFSRFLDYAIGGYLASVGAKIVE